MKRILLLDIDYTLLNTDILKVTLFEKIAKAVKNPREEILASRGTYLRPLEKGTDFNPDDYLRALSVKLKAELDDLKEAFFENDNFIRALYPETLSVLNDLKKDFRLGIFSEGFEGFQTAKLKKSGMYEYFDPKIIVIERRKTEKRALEKIPEGAIIVDDNFEVVEKLTNNKVDIIWLNRDALPNKKGFPSIKTLEELRKIL